MAKGFTVKAATPKQKKNEDTFNIAECRQLIRGKAIVFCLPGRGVSYQFLKSFVSLCFDHVGWSFGFCLLSNSSNLGTPLVTLDFSPTPA